MNVFTVNDSHLASLGELHVTQSNQFHDWQCCFKPSSFVSISCHGLFLGDSKSQSHILPVWTCLQALALNGIHRTPSALIQ